MAAEHLKDLITCGIMLVTLAGLVMIVRLIKELDGGV